MPHRPIRSSFISSCTRRWTHERRVLVYDGLCSLGQSISVGLVHFNTQITSCAARSSLSGFHADCCCSSCRSIFVHTINVTRDVIRSTITAKDQYTPDAFINRIDAGVSLLYFLEKEDRKSGRLSDMFIRLHSFMSYLF